MTLEEVIAYAADLKSNGTTGIDFVTALSNNGWAADGAGSFVEVAKTPGANGMGVGIGDIGDGSISSPNSPYNQSGLPSEGYNAMSGPDNATFMQKAFGGVDNGNKYSGIVAPVYNAASSIFKNVMAYQGLKDTRENNAKKFAMAEEGLERSRIDQGNKIAQARRYQQIGMGNSNSMAGTVGIVSRNPYSTYSKYVG